MRQTQLQIRCRVSREARTSDPSEIEEPKQRIFDPYPGRTCNRWSLAGNSCMSTTVLLLQQQWQCLRAVLARNLYIYSEPYLKQRLEIVQEACGQMSVLWGFWVVVVPAVEYDFKPC